MTIPSLSVVVSVKWKPTAADVALPAAGYLPRVTQDLVDALIAAAAGLDPPAA